MLCEQANAQLVEYAAHELSPATNREIAEHVSTCTTCQSDLANITAMQRLAEQWQDEIPPPLPALFGEPQRPPLHTGRAHWLTGFRQWFPTLASASALVLVSVMYFQQPGSNGVLPASPGAVNYEELPPLPQTASQAALVQSVLESSEEQRAKEIQALLKVLKAEMDKRTIQTEESLRYIITHQLQGQQELDELYRQVEQLMAEELAIDPPSSPAVTNGSM